MDVTNLTVEELFRLLSPNSSIQKELRSRGVIRTKNLVGEIGEYFVKRIFDTRPNLPNLFLPPPGVKNIDFLGRNGNRYSVKTVSSRKGTTGSFWKPDSIRNNEKIFEYLLVVILNDEYQLETILQLSWDDFFEYKRFNSRMNNYNISITRKLIENVTHIYDHNQIFT